MMQNLLVAAGCKGKAGYRIPFDQEFDEELPEATQDIAWIRSVPHNGTFENCGRCSNGRGIRATRSAWWS